MRCFRKSKNKGLSYFGILFFGKARERSFGFAREIVRHDFAERAIGTRSLTSKLADSLRLIITTNKNKGYCEKTQYPYLIVCN